MELVILAAGMGSRFGSLKQIEPMDEYGNFIIDYSIYDAVVAGFDKVVFIIKEENYDVFKNSIGKRIENRIRVEYAFQSLSLIPEGYSIPKERVKPLGTAQAILAAKPYVNDNFIMINADDFYGRDAFLVAAKYLKSLDNNSKNKYANVGYRVKNTITENGSVKRGILSFNEDNKLVSIEESSIYYENNKIMAFPLTDESNVHEINEDTLVSMNMFVFSKDIMDHIEEGFVNFMETNKDNLLKEEYLIPTVVTDLIQSGTSTVEVLNTKAKWYGVTYKEDKEEVVTSLKKLVDDGVYPKGLYN